MFTARETEMKCVRRNLVGMVTRRTSRPLSSFLLRVAEQRRESTGVQYELRDLRGGGVRRFASLAALARFLQTRHAVLLDDGDPEFERGNPLPPAKRKRRGRTDTEM